MKLERALEHLERAGYTTLEQVEALSEEALEKALGDNLAYRVSEALPEIKVPSRYTHTRTHTKPTHAHRTQRTTSKHSPINSS